jgi:hypothetical protein
MRSYGISRSVADISSCLEAIYSIAANAAYLGEALYRLAATRKDPL